MRAPMESVGSQVPVFLGRASLFQLVVSELIKLVNMGSIHRFNGTCLSKV